MAADFIVQLEERMEREGINQDKLAKLLNISKSAVSQFFNKPGNMKLNNIIKYARALGMKAAIIAYEDGDPGNRRGPINSEIFKICWENQGKPHDLWAFQETAKTAANIHEGATINYAQDITPDLLLDILGQRQWAGFAQCGMIAGEKDQYRIRVAPPYTVRGTASREGNKLQIDGILEVASEN